MTRACFSENKFYNSIKHKFTIKELLTEKIISIIKKLLHKHLSDLSSSYRISGIATYTDRVFNNKM